MTRFSGDSVHLRDEAQGLTLEMVRDWLKRDGYKLQASDAVGEVWDCAVGLPVILYENGDELGGAVQRIAENARRSVQAVLREMNPRMRKGLPSEAARSIAPIWIAKAASGQLLLGCFTWLRGAIAFETAGSCLTALGAPLAEWFFWPCDGMGNKTVWPVDEKGVML